jgi:hypothetical protein
MPLTTTVLSDLRDNSSTLGGSVLEAPLCEALLRERVVSWVCPEPLQQVASAQYSVLSAYATAQRHDPSVTWSRRLFRQ